QSVAVSVSSSLVTVRLVKPQSASTPSLTRRLTGNRATRTSKFVVSTSLLVRRAPPSLVSARPSQSRALWSTPPSWLLLLLTPQASSGGHHSPVLLLVSTGCTRATTSWSSTMT